MIYAVFLCDTKWKINKIRRCSKEIILKEGDILVNLISEKGNLRNTINNHYATEVILLKQNLTLTAVIDNFKEGKLVNLLQLKNNQDFLEWNNEYAGYLEWAKTYLFGLYHNEYYLIQQMNNQLVDTKRKLIRSNKKLESALEENGKINTKLKEARAIAEQANFSKTRFLANMSHDIRTPMNAIIGLSELMQHHLKEPESLKNYIAKLQSSSRYLLELINDILDLSKIENGSMELNIEPMNIREQIEQVITIIRPQITKKKQNFSVQSDCKEFGFLLGDSVRLRQVLMNLFSNAVKYTPEGGSIQLTIHEIERTNLERKYQFIIEDSGIGMTQEFMEHIFESFSRADTSVKEIQGTGLGMAISKNIIDAMGGSICVDSILGKGSQFKIEIPFKVCSEKDMANKVQINNQGKTILSLNGMKFLCAEDSDLNAEILQSILKLEGARCTIYENGKLLVEAFESIKPGEYDAILMDVQMPVMDGYEATRQIRNSANPLGKTIPIIAMTANAFSEDIQNCLEAGMDAHVSKPVNITILEKTLSQFAIER